MHHKMRITGPQSLGHLVQQVRSASGKTQAEFADELGISQRSITEIETGKATIQMRRLFELLKAGGGTLTGEWDSTDV